MEAFIVCTEVISGNCVISALITKRYCNKRTHAPAVNIRTCFIVSSPEKARL
jgi:hypothetical protein